MAISSARLEQLRAEFVPVKNRVDDIDRKYSLDYVEPLLDMPESLNLPRLTYTPKTDEELRAQAAEQTEAWYLSDKIRLENGYNSDITRLNVKIMSIDTREREKQAEYLEEYNAGVEKLRKILNDNGMLFSTAVTKADNELRAEYDNKVSVNAQSAKKDRAEVETERKTVMSNYNSAIENLEKERAAKEQTAYNKLSQYDYAEQVRIQKYNSQLDEKEKKYLVTRAKALEAARQAEYDRTYAARKLYQQMGSVGYEESMLWEKYNVFVKHFANFTKREEALVLIEGDSYVRGHLKQYYSTLVDWVNRNVPA